MLLTLFAPQGAAPPPPPQQVIDPDGSAERIARRNSDERRASEKARRGAVERAFAALDVEPQVGPLPAPVAREVAQIAELDLSGFDATLRELEEIARAIWQERQTLFRIEAMRRARELDEQAAIMALLTVM